MTNPLVEWSVAVRSLGERLEESGDQYLVHPYGDGMLVAAVDGLGHGPEAASAAKTAIALLETATEESLAELFTRCHERLRSTRGAVLSVASFSVGDGIMTWLGVGNVDGVLLRADGRSGATEHLMVRGGVVGHRLPALEASRLAVARGDTLIFATDGVQSGFAEDLKPDYPPHPTAERILAEYGKATDDALVLVVRYLGSAGRAAGRRGAGAPPSEASNPEHRAAGRRGAGAPPSEASNPEHRAAGRRGAGAPPSEASQSGAARAAGG